ncbi:MAG: hypothetical protein U0V72_05480 [Cytophagales bacterium]
MKYVLLTLVFFTNIMIAQKKLLKQANIDYQLGSFYKAKVNFEKYVSSKELSIEDQNKLCICKYQLSEFDEAQKCLQKIVQTNSQYPSSVDYFLAKSFLHENDLDSAKIHYQKYIQNLQTKNSNSELIQQIKSEYNQIVASQKQIVSSGVHSKIKNLGRPLNTKFPEYGPIISYDSKTLYFTSCRPEGMSLKIDESDGMFHEDIYQSNFNATNNTWTVPYLVDNINTNENDAILSLSKDGNIMLIYRHVFDIAHGTTSGDLYISYKQNSVWSKPTDLKELNTEYLESSATISPDNKAIIFSSNRPSGKGGRDLYISYLVDNNWSKPENISNLNTEKDEDSPFFTYDGKTMYFSSNGRGGLGGYDVYSANYNLPSNTWTNPKHITYPISTANDDLHFSLNATGNVVYTSFTTESGLGHKDLFEIDFMENQLGTIPINIQINGKELNLFDQKVSVYSTDFQKKFIYYTDSTGLVQACLPPSKVYFVEVNSEGYKPAYKTINLNTDQESSLINIFLVK